MASSSGSPQPDLLDHVIKFLSKREGIDKARAASHIPAPCSPCGLS